ncbi:MAG: hypothetical protein NC131_02610 [Roseburia sp.]|nr:hypothetical protein [Roseburia sp.]
MAEERLIDTDKDKKYRIKVNADGEEELEIVDGNEGAESEIEEVMFAVPEEGESRTESEGALSDEELAIKREREEAEAAERRQKAGELLEKAKNEIALYRFATALEFIEQAENIDGENGEAQALKLIAYTRNFTDYSQIVPASECADKLKEFTSAERKEELLKVAAPSLESEIGRLRSTVSAMNRENEEKKAERAVRFTRDRNIAIGVFCALFAVLVTFVALSAYYSTLIRTVPTNYYLVLTCVFAGLAVVALIGGALAARFLNIACRRVRLNKKNTTTKLGRDLLSEQAKLKAFIAVYSAIKGEK